MSDLSQAEIDQNKVIAKNQLAALANTLGPQMQALLAQDIKYKTNGEPHKKYLEAFEILYYNLPGRLQAYIEWGNYAIAVRLKNSYTNGEFSCQYIHDTVYLYDRVDNKTFTFLPRQTLTVQQYHSAKAKRNALKTKIQECEAEIDALNNIID